MRLIAKLSLEEVYDMVARELARTLPESIKGELILSKDGEGIAAYLVSKDTKEFS